jgi:hypothetical protein
MAIPFTQQVASTYDAVVNEKNRGADQWSDTSALNALEEMGGVKRVPGGATPSATLDYRQNQGGDFLLTDTTATATSKTEVLTQTSPSWATLVVPTNWSVTDEELNSDTNAKVPLIASLVDNAIMTHDYMIEQAMFATTGGTDGFATFVDLFTADGTGTVQGIVSGTETWWKNQFKDKATDTGATLLADYNTLYFSCQKGSLGRQPNVILANSTQYGTWLAANQANQRFLDAKEVRTLGAGKSAYHINARYIFSSVLTTAQNDAFMFNTNDTYLTVVKGAFRKRRSPVDFAAALMVNMKVYSILQLVTRNRSRGGLLFTT